MLPGYSSYNLDNSPAAHGVQDMELAAAYIPAAHWLGAIALLEHSCPAVHAVHVVCPVDVWYSPSGHTVWAPMPLFGHFEPIK